MNKKIIYGLSLIGLIFLIGINFNKANKLEHDQASDAMTSDQITGHISNEADVNETYNVLQENLKAANEKDVTAYTNTLITSAREETAKEMTPFFNDYDLENSLISFDVKKQSDDKIIVGTKQKTINKGTKEYRDHVTHATHTFVKEDGQWRIAETAMTKTDFIN